MPIPTLRDVIAHARKLIGTPETWTTRAYAKRADGVICESIRDPDAVCFCAAGAVRRAILDLAGPVLYGEEDGFELRKCARDALDQACGDLTGCSDLIAFNDNARTSHAEVLAVFDQALTTLDAVPA